MSQRCLKKSVIEEARGPRRSTSLVLRRAVVRSAACALTALAAALCNGHAHAGDRAVEACIASSDHAQELRDEGKLLAARNEFLTCARSVCPPLLQRDCAGWLADVEARVPSIVVNARDASDHEVADVRMSIDGALRFNRLDGRAVTLDPGEHLLRFERQGSPPVERRVLLREGEQRRAVAVRFAPSGSKSGPPAPTASASAAPAPTQSALPASTAAPPASASAAPPGSAPEPSVSRPVPPLVFVLSGVALAGGVAFALLAQSASSDFTHLEDTCAPKCADEDIDPVRTKALVANGALGVGVVALGVATWLWLKRPTQTAPAASSVGVSLAPTPGGGVAFLQGRF